MSFYIFFLKNIITEIYIPSFMPRNTCIFYIHLSICSTTVDMLLCRFICQMFVRRSYLLLGFVLRIVYECFCWFWNNPRVSYQTTDPICNHLLLLVVVVVVVVVMMQMMEYMWCPRCCCLGKDKNINGGIRVGRIEMWQKQNLVFCLISIFLLRYL